METNTVLLSVWVITKWARELQTKNYSCNYRLLSELQHARKNKTKQKTSIVLKLDSPQIWGFACLAGGFVFSFCSINVWSISSMKTLRKAGFHPRISREIITEEIACKKKWDYRNECSKMKKTVADIDNISAVRRQTQFIQYYLAAVRDVRPLSFQDSSEWPQPGANCSGPLGSVHLYIPVYLQHKSNGTVRNNLVGCSKAQPVKAMPLTQCP